MSQSRLLSLLHQKGYFVAEKLWTMVDDPDEYFEEPISERVLEHIGTNSYLISREMLMEIVPVFARENRVSCEEVRNQIRWGVISDILDFYGAYRCDFIVETSFGDADIVAIGVE